MTDGLIDITEDEFKKLSDLIYNTFGIKLTDVKKALVKSRLNKLLKTLGFDNFTDYYQYVITSKSKDSILTLIDKISTNHTFFFREDSHFDYLKQTVLPELSTLKKAHNEYTVKIWSAGCSTGEEAYSLAMILQEYFNSGMPTWNIRILATDISTTVLQTAQKGEYTKEQVTNIPVMLRNKYFQTIDKNTVKVKDALKNMILFKRLNLMNETFPFKGKFDIIFCRNVMIYFDKKVRRELTDRFARFTYDNGYLFVGHSESLFKETMKFKYIKPAIYKKI